MRLTLTYRGPLHAASSGGLMEKHKIRHQFHDQLKDAWRTHPALEGRLDGWYELPQAQRTTNAEPTFVTAFEVGEFCFVPLITKRFSLACELEMLFLRREPAGYIVDSNSADIDNRIKLLFDALRMPQSASEIPATEPPNDNDYPFFCLLEDDALITRFSIESERLLHPPVQTDSEVELVIRAKIRAVKTTWATLGMSSD